MLGRVIQVVKFVCIVCLLAACKSGGFGSDQAIPTSGPSLAGTVELQQVFTNISFNTPLTMVQAPQNNSKWYLIEKAGRVYSFDNDVNATTRYLLLDISNEVDNGYQEAGLLGIALDPNFKDNGYVYLSYVTSDDPVNDFGLNLVSRISRFTMDSSAAVLDPNSELVILTLAQPYENHKGGNIAFGQDGYLYVGFGDGGSAGDPQNNAQNLDVLLGKMLRIDVNVTQADINNGITYKIPSDNPFASSSGCGASLSTHCPELYAWGFRNPWRWSFDRETGALWAGDVGQDTIEEVDLVDSGHNYGWRCYEGSNTYNTNLCSDPSVYTPPIAQYTHGFGDAITGGYVYRGNAISALSGVYLYTDFYSGRLWGVTDPYGNATAQEIMSTGLNIPSFAQDANGELYLVSISGEIYQLVPHS